MKKETLLSGLLGGIQNRQRFAPTIFLVQKPFSKICGQASMPFAPSMGNATLSSYKLYNR